MIDPVGTEGVSGPDSGSLGCKWTPLCGQVLPEPRGLSAVLTAALLSQRAAICKLCGVILLHSNRCS